jgi:hypothetical protein
LVLSKFRGSKFVPFDPATKMSETRAVHRDGKNLRAGHTVGMCVILSAILTVETSLGWP